MSQPLPGLSGLDKAGLQAAHLAEIGTEAGEQTVDQLRDALKAHREANPPAPAAPEVAAVEELKAGPGEIVGTHAEYGDRLFTDLTWSTLQDREGERAGWEEKVAKPALAAK